MALTKSNPQSWLDEVWDALHAFHEAYDIIITDSQWDDICTAMAWITEELEERK